MAIYCGNNTYTYVGEHSITVGSVTGSSSKTVTTTGIPKTLDSTMVPMVTSTTLTDAGLGIGHAWITVSGTTPTLNIKILNSAATQTPASDPITFKVVIA